MIGAGRTFRSQRTLQSFGIYGQTANRQDTRESYIFPEYDGIVRSPAMYLQRSITTGNSPPIAVPRPTIYRMGGEDYLWQ